MQDRFVDKDFILGGRWETCCLKQRPKDGEPKPATGYVAYGVITSSRPPITVYLRGEDPKDDFRRTKSYETVDDLLQDGWIVD